MSEKWNDLNINGEYLEKLVESMLPIQIVQKPRSGQICHLFLRTLLFSKIVDIYIPFSKTEKKLKWFSVCNNKVRTLLRHAVDDFLLGYIET